MSDEISKIEKQLYELTMKLNELRKSHSGDEVRNYTFSTLDGDVVWRNTITAHHDAEMTPDGKIATLTYQFRSIPAVDETHEVKDHKITLLTADGEVLEEHSLYDMLCTDPDRSPWPRTP